MTHFQHHSTYAAQIEELFSLNVVPFEYIDSEAKYDSDVRYFIKNAKHDIFENLRLPSPKLAGTNRSSAVPRQAIQATPLNCLIPQWSPSPYNEVDISSSGRFQRSDYDNTDLIFAGDSIAGTCNERNVRPKLAPDKLIQKLRDKLQATSNV